MKKASLFGLLLLCLGSALHAQSAKWEIGPSIGVFNYAGDLVPNTLPKLNTAQPGFGLFLRRNLGEAFSLRFNGMYGTIAGNDADYANRAARKFSFETQIGEFSVLGEYDFRGRKRYNRGHLHKMISPYVYAGIGGLGYDNNTNYSTAEQAASMLPLINQDLAEKTPAIGLSIPFGGGFRFDLSQKVSLALETGFHVPFTDHLDGVSASGNPDQNDWLLNSSALLSYRFGKYKDSDGDRVFDRYDDCPNMPGEKTLAGCPDTDGDGVIDEKDQCPYQRGSSGMNGCPDRDGDGTIDKEDLCPDLHGPKLLKGCPDKDADGIADFEDSCPDIGGVLTARGCPDADLDSIPNLLDKCPTEAGPLVNNGCPDKDTDGDGLVDRLDNCPDKAGLRVLNGCPDADGDGITDAKDRCPNAAGTTANNGCPELKQEEKEVLKLAVRGVQFDPSKATLKKTSFAILDQIVDILKRYPDYNLAISGHTDGDGDDKKNMTLSDNRAKTCRDYLVTKGIDTKRLTYKGYGETKPVAPNTTKDNKALNRRVEFDLKLKE